MKILDEISEQKALNMNYIGFHPSSKQFKIKIIDINKYNPETFYNEFIKTRTPVVITDDGTSKNSILRNFQEWRNLAFLRKVAGDQVVQVEKRETSDDGFGKANRRVTMAFKDLIDIHLSTDDEGDDYYMTTQYEDNFDVNKMFCQSPLRGKLHTLIPKRPALLSPLVPQQMNLWMGRCSRGQNQENGVSSGLHHDYADNLYLLLKGRKRFTLFSPKDAFYLSTIGTIKTVFPNGLITYCGSNDDSSESDDELFREDGAFIKDVQTHSSAAPAAKKRKAYSETSDSEVWDFNGKDDFDSVSVSSSAGERSLPEPEFPPSFSRIPSVDLNGFSKSKFPGLAKATKLHLTLEENQMLYLPASWFHEVTSFPKDPENTVHLAFNYWFHPPSHQGTFKSPYIDNYWENFYKSNITP